jgi:hypothetical protein
MTLEKFGFRIRAHNGALIDHLVIQASGADEARSKLLRMYPHCEVLATWTESQGTVNPNSKSFEDIADLLNH